MQKNKKKIIISICIPLLCIAAVLTYYNLTQKADGNIKTITVTVNHLHKENKTLKITTKADFLGEALKKSKLIDGSDSKSGFLLSSVDGEKANTDENQWWGFTKSGKYLDTAIDKTPISDGDIFEFSLHAG